MIIQVNYNWPGGCKKWKRGKNDWLCKLILLSLKETHGKTTGMFAQTVNLILLISFLNIVLVVGLSWNGQMERKMNN